MPGIVVIGGGLAGVEAAWQITMRGVPVTLFEMRPAKTTPAHRTGLLAELVCSNTLGGVGLLTPRGLLKEEMKLLGSLVMDAAARTSVPAGKALAVDRNTFSEYITDAITSNRLIEVVMEEVTDIPEGIVIIATGPLTSDAFALRLREFLGKDYLYFYDAISPIVYADSIDYSKCFWASRYGEGGNDYLNCPMSEEEYNVFYDALVSAKSVPYKDFEVFEGCMPIEDMARRGRKTLLFGPMRPVGLVDPATGKMPYAAVQLRKENVEGSLLNMVGFQTKLTYPEQRRVFRLIPGLGNAEFARYGSVHRNIFINSPRLLLKTLQCRKDRRVFFAGQITGVEGYVESAATGIIAGINAARILKGESAVYPPETTMIGGLISYITGADPGGFQPMNANFGLLPSVNIRGKMKRRKLLSHRAVESMKVWLKQL